ncbi:hypothetical protein MKW98_027101 [Papaver atlanticum]|uniref:PGG domain-containing protein n=1 Tax=Papaver atlanticum TaxID=357466 RepID=A0AAD4S4S9_9MAGN|nr:hypothetical protein MKW98_027101 [Papaver atlanticum]
MSVKELSNGHGNNRPHEEMTEIKELLKLLVESQAKQENIQNQMLQVLRSINSASNKPKAEDDIDNNNSANNNTVDLQEITKESDENQPSKDEEGVIRVGDHNPDRNDLLYEGDCQKTIKFLRNNPEALKQGVTHDSYTVLHVAIFRKREMVLIEEIVKLIAPELLEHKAGEYESTALHLAARHGNLEEVKLLVNRNPKLLCIHDKNGLTPIQVAVVNITNGQKEVTEYLYPVTKARFFFLRCLIEANFYDMALCLIKQMPELVLEISHKYGIGRLSMSALEMMVRRPFAFRSGTKLTWWQDLIYSLIQVEMNTVCCQPVEPNRCQAGCSIRDEENSLPKVLNCTKAGESSKFSSSSSTYKRIVMLYLTKASALIKQMFVELKKETNAQTLMKFFDKNPNIMKTAIKNGITEFVAECLEKFDYLIWPRISGETMLETAIIERKEMIANMILETSDKFDETITLLSRVDLDDGNTILHYAAKRASSAQLNLISGAALQMQREVQCILRESDRLSRNKNGDPAQFVFSEEHKDLLKEGEDWLMDTSGSCMIVAALIATVAFAAAFTVPGGNISDSNSALNGTPVFLGKSSFTMFAIADALALFSSITSVLMFLAIYTSRYAKIDFLKSLPQKLIFGLATLFISMVAILVAFGASLFIVVGNKFVQASVPIVVFSSCPLALFAWLQLPLFVEMVRHTYWGSLFQKHRLVDFSAQKNNNKSKKREKRN